MPKKPRAVIERALDDQERESIANLASRARKKLKLAAAASPEKVIAAIGAFIDSVRKKKRALPRDDETLMGLGALWGEQLRARTGWEWLHLTYAEGFKSYGLAPKDRHCACFPLNDIPEQMSLEKRDENTSILLFNMVVAGRTPETKDKAYTPFG